MRLVNIQSLKPGAILAQPIHNENGLTLIQQNICLTEKMIQRLLKQGINYVYVEDELTNDIYVESVIPNKLRVEAVDIIKDTFEELKNNNFTGKSYLLDKREKRLTAVIEKIMKEISGQENAISLLADILLTDDYTFQHSLNVTIYSLAIGIKLNFSEKELSEIGIGAILHDIGKIFIDEEILQKPKALSDEEFEIMKEHTQLGFDFLRRQTDLSSVVAHCAYQHHERLDGSGYPRGLNSSDIHKYAKVIAIADVFDAVTSNRIYRNAMLPHEGLEILYANAVDKFEPTMVEAFKKSVVIYPNGLSVELSDGRMGVVSKQNNHLRDRPVVRIIKENNREATVPYEVDLASAVNITVISCYTE